MSKNDMGILIFKEWFKAMLELPAIDVKKLLEAIYDCQYEGSEPPEFKGKAKMLAEIIFPYIKRRNAAFANGKKSALARAARGEITVPTRGESETKVGAQESKTTVESVTLFATDGKSLFATSSAPSFATSKEEKRKEEYSRVERSKEEKSKEEEVSGGSAPEDLCAATDDRDALNALGHEKERADAFKDEEAAKADRVGTFGAVGGPASKKSGDLDDDDEPDTGKRAYGKYKNVFLTEREYAEIDERIPYADFYIDKFSEKLYNFGYRYACHAQAIREWWERDGNFERRRAEQGFGKSSEPTVCREPDPMVCREPEPIVCRDPSLLEGASITSDSSPSSGGEYRPRVGSFDTDSFFEAAVRRSLGEQYPDAEASTREKKHT